MNPIPLIALAAAVYYLHRMSNSSPRIPSEPENKDNEPAYIEDELPEPPPGPYDGLPQMGSSGCTAGFYQSSSSGLSSSVLALMNSAARAYVTPPGGKRIWSDAKGNVYVFQQGSTRLVSSAQVAVYKAALSRLSLPTRSTLAVTTREVLKSVIPECNWDLDLAPSFGHQGFDKRQYNLFVSAWYLVNAAARQLGIIPKYPGQHLMVPVGNNKGLVIGRGFLGLPDVATPGKVFLEPGRRVGLLVGDYRTGQWPNPPFFHSEPVVAQVLDSNSGRPRVEILKFFNGQDVSPKYAHKHGFYVGRVLRLPSSGTTAIQRIYPSGAD